MPIRGRAFPLWLSACGLAADQVAARVGLVQRSGGGWPLPVDPAQVITRLYKHSPALKVPGHGAVVTKPLGAADAIGSRCAGGR
jgi:hypothetical protein